MNTVIVTDAYPPEIRSASHLMVELADELNKRGHTVTILTSYPSYNLDEASKNKHYDEYTLEDSINVIRVKTLPHHNTGFLVRGIAQVMMPNQFLRRLKKHVKGPVDNVVVYSPPLPLAKVGAKLKQKYGAKFVLNVQDLFPQNAIDLGILKNRMLIRWFEKIEKKAYQNADIVTVHSSGNKQFLIESGKIPNEEKLTILHNWIDVDGIQNDGLNIDFRKKYKLEDKFILLFAGVLGPSQGLDMVVDVANLLKDQEDLVFLIVGDGMEKKNLEAKVRELGLGNVLFKPFVSKEEYPSLVKCVDVGIVSLTQKNKTPVVPGKILGYMAAAKPVLAFINTESDGHGIIEAAQCGISEKSSESPDRLAEVTRELLADRAKLIEKGENGFRYVSKEFERNSCIDQLEQYFILRGEKIN